MKFYASNCNFSGEVEALTLPEAIWKLSVSYSYKFSSDQLKEVQIKDKYGKLLAQTDVEPISYDIFRKLSQLGIVNFEDEFSVQNSEVLYWQIVKQEAARKVWEEEKTALTSRYEAELKAMENRIKFSRSQSDLMLDAAEKRSQASEAAWLYSLHGCTSRALALADSVNISQIHVCTDLLDADEACQAVWQHPKTFGTLITDHLDEVFSHPVEIQCWRFESLDSDKVYLRIGSGLIEFSFPAGFRFGTVGKQLIPTSGGQNKGADFAIFLQGLFDRFNLFKGKLKVNLFQGKFAPAVRFFSYAYEPSALLDLPTVENSATSKSRGYDVAFHTLGKVFGKIRNGVYSFQREEEPSKLELVSFLAPIAIDQISKEKLIAMAFSPRMQMQNPTRDFSILRDLVRIKIREADLTKEAISGLIGSLNCKDNLAAILFLEREIDVLKTRLINLGQIFPNQVFIPTEKQLEQIKRRYLARFSKNKTEGTEEEKKRTRRKSESRKMKKSQKEAKRKN